MTHDMTHNEFVDACKRYGFVRKGFMGYYDVGGIEVSVYNAGQRRRDWLAYLLKMRDKYANKLAAAGT